MPIEPIVAGRGREREAAPQPSRLPVDRVAAANKCEPRDFPQRHSPAGERIGARIGAHDLDAERRQRRGKAGEPVEPAHRREAIESPQARRLAGDGKAAVRRRDPVAVLNAGGAAGERISPGIRDEPLVLTNRRRLPAYAATAPRRSSSPKSGHSVSTNTSSEYASCQSRKFEIRCSPEVRMTRSGSGMSGA